MILIITGTTNGTVNVLGYLSIGFVRFTKYFHAIWSN